MRVSIIAAGTRFWVAIGVGPERVWLLSAYVEILGSMMILVVIVYLLWCLKGKLVEGG